MSTFSGTIAISALLGATMLASPLTAIAADSAPSASAQPVQATMPKGQAAAPTPEATRETVEPAPRSDESRPPFDLLTN